MHTIHLSTPAQLQAYLRESLEYSVLKPEPRSRWLDHGLRAWGLPLLDAGYAAIPFCLILDIGTRVTQPGPVMRPPGALLSSHEIIRRYAAGLDALFRNPGLRDLMNEIGSGRNDADMVLFLFRFLRPVLSRIPFAVSISTASYDIESLADVSPGHAYGRHIESALEGFVNHIRDASPERAGLNALMAPEERLFILASIRQEHLLSFPDLRLIERCMRMDDLPFPVAGEESRLIRTLHTLRLEQPSSRSARPDGGYAGLRNNGGLEDMGSPALSEWAAPAPILWEKLAHRRLMVYERSSHELFVHSMGIHLILFGSTRLAQPDGQIRHVPLQEVKRLMASLIRDLARYLTHLNGVTVEITIRLSGADHDGDDRRTVTLTGLSEETIRNPRCFLLDLRETFPWFFSTRLSGEGVLEPDRGKDPFFDLSEAPYTASDTPAEYPVKKYGNNHVLVFCVSDHYSVVRDHVLEQLGDRLDLSPAGNESLVFFPTFLSPEPTWSFEPERRVYRSTHPAIRPLPEGGLTSEGIRSGYRDYFFSRLSGGRSRSQSRNNTVQHDPF